MIDFGTFVDQKIFYQIDNGNDEGGFSWSANLDLNYEAFYSEPGEIVVLDRGLFVIYIFIYFCIFLIQFLVEFVILNILWYNKLINNF